jgi:hypothetical protein
MQLLMQWAFIFYHYYRVYYVYNEIRVFVSAYVWMVSSGKMCKSRTMHTVMILDNERSTLTTIHNYFSIATRHHKNVAQC